MSTTSSSATTTLYVNGKPAQDELARLRAEVDKYKKQLMDIAADPSKGLGSTAWSNTLKKVKATEKELDKVQSNVSSVSQALTRLDKATPEELSKALRQLNKELASIERGSKAWKEQVKKIRAVKEELAKVNGEIRVQESRWQRFNRIVNEWQMTIMGAAAAVTGIVMAGKAAVQVYADIDAEMASVRKFTGMTAEEVEKLNEAFKKIDTRTSREDLNKLAQEAGRLGLQSEADVLGFVKAANQINVALDDLGEGATLTLSKLTDIFGDKQRLGVEQSLLAVGSVINELSQNCTASAPYLANFAQRMAGVGAQAGMTVQQIMAFAAVLDSQGQAVEMSATALSQLILKSMKDPARIAKALGLELQQFSAMLKTDTNEALLMILQRMHELGDLNALAPVFHDMGTDGARASQVISALAGNIDMVRQQQREANKAFAEGTSVTKEYNVQNNTAQAQLDKARKGFTEMAASLGQKLMPVMRYAISSTSALMRVMSVFVDFIIKYKAAIATFAVSWVVYKVAVNASTIALRAHYAWLVISQGTMKALSTATLALKVAFFGLTGQVNKAKAAYTAFHLLTKSTPWGLILSAITAVVAGIVHFVNKTREANQKLREQREEFAKWQLSLTNIDEASAQYSANEITRLKALYKEATNEALSKEKRIEAAKRLQQLYPSVFGSLTTEAILTGQAAQQYRDLTSAIIASARARAAAAKIEENEKELLELEGTLETQREDEQRKTAHADKVKQEADKKKQAAREKAQGDALGDIRESNTAQRERERVYNQENRKADEARAAADAATAARRQTERKIAALNKANETLAKKYEISAKDLENQSVDFKPYTPTGGSGTTGGSGGGGSTATVDKFKAEKEWREKQEALNRIAYATGVVDYEQYTKRMNEIMVEFYEKQLAHTDLSENERLNISAQYAEEMKKTDELSMKRRITEEKRGYEDLKAETQQDYLDGKLSKQAYDMQMENIEFAHLRALVDLAEEGSEERRNAEETYRQRLVADQQKRHAEYLANEKAQSDQLDAVWDKYAEDEESKREKMVEETKETLKLAYEMRKALIMNDDSLSPDEKAKQLSELENKYKKAIKAVNDAAKEAAAATGKSWEDWIGKALDKIFGEGTWAKYGATVKQAFASMTAMMQSFNQLAQAEAEVKIANLEKQYDREISMAEGNNRKVKALERKKEKETARIKAEAQRKEFAQQVMNAISSTALAAINAYASASKIAWWLGPVAAGLALAAGAVQIAAIKKQQEASDAKGFAEGGFTPKGPKDKPVGVVHAGEWVASQRLLADPVARPMIEALDYAQRNNTLGSLRPADVSRSVTAPAVIAGAASDGQTERLMVAVAAALGNYDGTMARLTDRLNEPFVTVNTVTGDMGIKEAQDEYQRLMNNTLPKSKRK